MDGNRFPAAPIVIGLALAACVWPAERKPSPAEQREFLAVARRHAVEYFRLLPDYICTEEIQRWASASRAGLHFLDRLTVRLSYYQGREQHDLVAINNHPTSKPYESVGGLTNFGEFGSVLMLVINPELPTAFRFRDWTSIGKRRAARYDYELPLPGSDYELILREQGKTSRQRVGLTGEIAIDRETYDVLSLTYRAEANDFPLRRLRVTVEYANVKIGGVNFLLPSSATMSAGASSDRTVISTAKFQNYSKFSSDSTVTFGQEVLRQ